MPTVSTFLLHNMRLKVIALVVACAMWVGVVYATNPPEISTFYLPVHPSGLATSLVVVGAPARQPIKVLGVATNVNHARTLSDVAASVNLAHLTEPGHYNLPLQVSDSDSGVVVWSKPDRVSVVVDRLVTAKIPVRVKFSALPPAGYIVDQAKTVISPSSVTVTGPQTVLPGLTATAVVSLSGVRSSLAFPEHVKLGNLPAGIGHVTLNTPAVSVQVVVTSQTSEASLPVLVQLPRDSSPPSGYELTGIQVLPVTVAATGPAATLASLAGIDTQPIDISHITSDTTVSIRLAAPSGVTVSPGLVSVVVNVAPIPVATPTPSPSPSPTPTPSPSPSG